MANFWGSKYFVFNVSKAYYNLIPGFRNWIGQSSKLAVDPETGEEYTWEDVIHFDDNLSSIQKGTARPPTMLL